MAVDPTIPEVGESITEVEIGEWIKKEGDLVNQDDTIVMIETDKVTVELPAPVSGKITHNALRKGTFIGSYKVAIFPARTTLTSKLKVRIVILFMCYQ